MFVLKNLEKIKEMRLTSCQGSVTIIKKMITYQNEWRKQTQKLKKLTFATKNKKGAIWRLNMKNVKDEELPHKLFVTTKQWIKTCNAIANNF